MPFSEREHSDNGMQHSGLRWSRQQKLIKMVSYGEAEERTTGCISDRKRLIDHAQCLDESLMREPFTLPTHFAIWFDDARSFQIDCFGVSGSERSSLKADGLMFIHRPPAHASLLVHYGRTKASIDTLSHPVIRQQDELRNKLFITTDPGYRYA